MLNHKNGRNKYSNGSEVWWLNDMPHREDRSAIINVPMGVRYWAKYGKYHREDGPAIEYENGRKEWWFEGQKIATQAEFEQLLRLKAFW